MGYILPHLAPEPHIEMDGPLDPSIFTALAKESVTNRIRIDSYSGPGSRWAWWGQ